MKLKVNLTENFERNDCSSITAKLVGKDDENLSWIEGRLFPICECFLSSNTDLSLESESHFLSFSFFFFFKSYLTWKSQSRGLVTYKSFLSDLSTAAERIIQALQKLQPNRFFSHFAYITFIVTVRYHGLFPHIFCDYTCQPADWLPVHLIQLAKVIRRCDWEDNKYVLPSCIGTPQWIALRWRPSPWLSCF